MRTKVIRTLVFMASILLVSPHPATSQSWIACFERNEAFASLAALRTASLTQPEARIELAELWLALGLPDSASVTLATIGADAEVPALYRMRRALAEARVDLRRATSVGAEYADSAGQHIAYARRHLTAEAPDAWSTELRFVEQEVLVIRGLVRSDEAATREARHIVDSLATSHDEEVVWEAQRRQIVAELGRRNPRGASATFEALEPTWQDQTTCAQRAFAGVASWYFESSGDATRAATWTQREVAAALQLGSVYRTGLAFRDLAERHAAAGSLRNGVPLYLLAQRLLLSASEFAAVADIDHDLGAAFHAIGRDDLAGAYLARALERYEGIGDPLGVSKTRTLQLDLGKSSFDRAFDRGQYTQAISRLERLLESREVGLAELEPSVPMPIDSALQLDVPPVPNPPSYASAAAGLDYTDYVDRKRAEYLRGKLKLLATHADSVRAAFRHFALSAALREYQLYEQVGHTDLLFAAEDPSDQGADLYDLWARAALQHPDLQADEGHTAALAIVLRGRGLSLRIANGADRSPLWSSPQAAAEAGRQIQRAIMSDERLVTYAISGGRLLTLVATRSDIAVVETVVSEDPADGAVWAVYQEALAAQAESDQRLREILQRGAAAGLVTQDELFLNDHDTPADSARLVFEFRGKQLRDRLRVLVTESRGAVGDPGVESVLEQLRYGGAIAEAGIPATSMDQLRDLIFPPEVEDLVQEATVLTIVVPGLLADAPIEALPTHSGRVGLRFAVVRQMTWSPSRGYNVDPGSDGRALIIAAGDGRRLVAPWGDTINEGPLNAVHSERDSTSLALRAAGWVVDTAETEEALRHAGPTASLVHIAAHAKAETQFDRANQSWMLLSASGADDGLFTSGDVRDIDWLTEVVVLSACETGFGTTSLNEGLLGLQHAFLSSGVNAVVATLWPVPDRAAEEFSAAFYEALLDGQTVASSTLEGRRAVREWLDDPRAWGAFHLSVR